MKIDKDIILKKLPQFSAHRVAVAGDVILDEYLIGQPERLSREAPIPVLELSERKTIPGGAANPAMNLAALKAETTLVGLVGEDDAGKELIARLRAANLDAGGIVKDPHRQTTQKTRIISRGGFRGEQQLARLDRVDRHPPSAEVEENLIIQLKIATAVSSAILLSDYRNGMISRAMVSAAIEAARNAGNLLIVDSQGDLGKYKGCDVIRANDRDVSTYLGYPLETEADFERATATLLDSLETHGIVIGRGAQGVSLRGQRTPYHHFPAVNQTEVYDVTGAGDTSVAVLALGIVARLDLAHAAFLANIAAGEVVRKLGNATLSPEDLTHAVELAKI